MTHSKESEAKYEICLTASLDCASYLLMQGHAFCGHDESSSSSNKGNFLDKNVRMLAPPVQKDLAKSCAQDITKEIKKEIGDGYFSILIDESRDISIKEQMTVIVRFVNKKGKVMERFLGLKHVTETTSDALKGALFELLSTHGLDIARVRGQGYDGASSMRGEFNGLQKLIRDENPYAFYVHCFAHQLQLVVVSVVGSCTSIHEFFEYVNMIVITTSASCKRKNLLSSKHRENLLAKLDSSNIFFWKRETSRN
ncbi:uncharacterized protein LOC133884813 [Phragmites australis]|uniref:uncharacterized protein LOC133884813 n=1 Tax=Phragmites australis TaxID=29695 RepID=UPI002D791306|nr:uncharacterized protein LOC133884813 [Phragmites australis]